MIFQNSEGLKLYYEYHVKPQAKQTIVLLNGLSQSTLSWSLLTPYLQNYHVLLMDFIFQGQSDKEGEWRNFDTHAKDVHELITYLNLPQPYIAGLSYGSLVAQHFAVRYPLALQKLILMATFAHKTPYFEAIETAWWSALQKGGYPLLLDVMLPSVLSEDYFKNPLIPIEMMKEARKGANEDSSALLKLMRATKERPDYREKLNSITCPTLIIHGEKDLLIPSHLGEEVHKNISGSAFEIIPRVGHTLNLEGVQTVAKLITRFLD